MAKLIFYPLGNADSTLIHLADDRLILEDFGSRELEGEDDKRVDLSEELHAYLAERGRTDFDVVAFSHADDDHTHGAEDFFWFDHAAKYQSKERIRIGELWVPACFVLETTCEGSAEIIQAEARYRLKKGSGIRVFGNPEPLEQWLEAQGIKPATRLHLISKAGTCVPGFSEREGQVEIFVHSPFSFRMEGEQVERNGNSLVWQLTFFESGKGFPCILGADCMYDTWVDIVQISRQQRNENRLDWDLFRISHHCSYKSLATEKGKTETKPHPEIAYLFERGSNGALLISSSDVIPTVDTDQPPHRQAAAYYRRIAREKATESNFIVTMAWPSPGAPRPLVIETTQYGFMKRQEVIGGTASVLNQPTPRFGSVDGR